MIIPREINIYTKLDAYPLPGEDDMINKLAMYTVFSLLPIFVVHAIKLKWFNLTVNLLR